jgi:tetratricopeptide (TPR) repeat protein
VTVDISEDRAADAKTRIEQWLTQRPRDAQALVLAAMVHTNMGGAQEAEKLLRTAIEVDPRQLRAYEMLAQLYLAQQRLDESRAEFDNIAARSAAHVGAATMAAIILTVQGKQPEAQQRYEQIVAKNPRAAVAANNLAWMYAERGEKLNEALELAQSAKAELPDEPEINDTLGYVYLKRNLGQLAIRPFQDAVTKQPKNPSFRLHLGQAYAQAGDTSAARRELEEALRLSADFEGAAEARRLLAEVQGK